MDSFKLVNLSSLICSQTAFQILVMKWRWWFPLACYTCLPPLPSFLPGWVLCRAVCQSPAASHLRWGRGSFSWALWTPSSSPAWPSHLEPAAWAAHGEGRWGSIFLGVSLWRVAWLPCPWACRRSVQSSSRVGGGMVLALPTRWTSTAELSVDTGQMDGNTWLCR